MTYKFKSGTYLKSLSTGEISRLRQDTNKVDETKFKLWSPEPQEWCWFYDEKRFTTTGGSRKLLFGRFQGMYDGSFMCKTFDGNEHIMDECYPFLGNLEELPDCCK